MDILGLDLSTRKSGYSLFKNEKAVEFGVWSLVDDKEMTWRERIVWMAKQFDAYCNEHNIDLVYCEDVPPIVDKNTQTVKTLSALQGCIIAICTLRDITIKFVPVTTWKNIIGIDLTHSKEYKAFVKLHKDEELNLFKKYVKHYEKALSVENANLHIMHTQKSLQWVSFESKFNQDDIADSINVVLSQVDAERARYKQEGFSTIIERLYFLSKANVEKKRRGFKERK